MAPEYNGDAYACDHFVDSDYRIGNLADGVMTWLSASGSTMHDSAGSVLAGQEGATHE